MKDPLEIKEQKEITPKNMLKGIVGLALGLAILQPILNLFKGGSK